MKEFVVHYVIRALRRANFYRDRATATRAPPIYNHKQHGTTQPAGIIINVRRTVLIHGATPSSAAQVKECLDVGEYGRNAEHCLPPDMPPDAQQTSLDAIVTSSS